MMPYYDEDEAVELAAEDRAREARQWRLIRHPDCRDPDHPGCSSCEPSDDHDTEE